MYVCYFLVCVINVNAMVDLAHRQQLIQYMIVLETFRHILQVYDSKGDIA